uniref:cilia- and flagella-associated protein 184 isoform X2 n=1 Tax=Pristiophorus japonicus TaxID=55135 RepID=UPI00398E79BB
MVKFGEQLSSALQSHRKQEGLIEEEEEEDGAAETLEKAEAPSMVQFQMEEKPDEPEIPEEASADEKEQPAAGEEAAKGNEMDSDEKEVNLLPDNDETPQEAQETNIGEDTQEIEEPKSSEIPEEVSEKQMETSSNVEEENPDELKMVGIVSDEETKEMEKGISPLPTSDTFTKGEKEESLTLIGEDLARSDSPVKEEFANGLPILEPGTPESKETPTREDKDGAWVEDVDQNAIDRQELEDTYHELFVERERLKIHNSQIQNKLADYYRRKKEETKSEIKKPQSDYGPRFHKFMDSLAKLQASYKEEVELYREQIAELSAHSEEKQQLTDSAWKMFQSKKKAMAKTAINKRPGRHIVLQELERIQSIEEQREKEMRQIRFLTIKMKNKLMYYEHQLKAKEELVGGLNLIDYEQLKIENQSYSEKIEERTEEVTKMRKKIAITIQVMTHIKEKLEYVEVENAGKKAQLMEVEAIVAQKREILTKTKQVRDRVRVANYKLKEQCGLLCNKVLLRDFEDNVDTSGRLQNHLEALKLRHADLTLDTYGIKKKIEWVKTGQLQAQ